MQTAALHHEMVQTVPAGQLHPAQHLEGHSVKDAMVFATRFSLACFIPFGFLVGLDRSATYGSGVSGMIWPMILAVSLGVGVGILVGFVMGAIQHASDPSSEVKPVEVPTPEMSQTRDLRLTPHGRL